MAQQNTSNCDANGNSGTEKPISPVPNGTKTRDFATPALSNTTKLESKSSAGSNAFRPDNEKVITAYEDTWVDWDGPVWCSRYGRFENQEDAAADDGYKMKGIRAHHDFNLYRCECRVPSPHRSYAVDIQRRIEPLVESMVRLEHRVEQLAHHAMKDTENFVQTGHHHRSTDVRSTTETPTATSSKLNSDNSLTIKKEMVANKMGDDNPSPSLDGKRFQHPPQQLLWNQEPDHKHREPLALTIAKLEHQVRYLTHQMGEMLRDGLMMKETKGDQEAWERTQNHLGLAKETQG